MWGLSFVHVSQVTVTVTIGLHYAFAGPTQHGNAIPIGFVATTLGLGIQHRLLFFVLGGFRHFVIVLIGFRHFRIVELVNAFVPLLVPLFHLFECLHRVGFVCK